MKMKFLGILAIVIAISASAFTTKHATSNFYIYTSGSVAQADIQNINNYLASSSDPCTATDANVCGVTLSTAHTDGTTPVVSEFNAEKTDLWTSQQNGTRADNKIGMKP
jgi:hypothetical protein